MKSKAELEKLNAELEALNSEVTAVLAKRSSWMDAHMEDFARFKIGDEIYDMDSGRRLGIVSKLYRYWGGDRNPLDDTSLSIEYEYRTDGFLGGNGFYDNTSRQSISIGTAQELADRLKARAEYAQRMADGTGLFQGVGKS